MERPFWIELPCSEAVYLRVSTAASWPTSFSTFCVPAGDRLKKRGWARDTVWGFHLVFISAGLWSFGGLVQPPPLTMTSQTWWDGGETENSPPRPQIAWTWLWRVIALMCVRRAQVSHGHTDGTGVVVMTVHTICPPKRVSLLAPPRSHKWLFLPKLALCNAVVMGWHVTCGRTNPGVFYLFDLFLSCRIGLLLGYSRLALCLSRMSGHHCWWTSRLESCCSHRLLWEKPIFRKVGTFPPHSFQ